MQEETVPNTWYQMSVSTVSASLNTDETSGLSRQEADIRQTRSGPNTLPEKKAPPLILAFFDQFRNLLVIILLFAALLSLFIGDVLDGVAILAIVLLNATIGFFQEMQAEKTIHSLRKTDIAYTLVIRQGRMEKIPVSDVVSGDILMLEEGENVPADARVIESFSLRVDESILTGESTPVSKDNTPLALADLSVSEQRNMIFRDTKIMAGRGKAIVTATGRQTEIGKIASALEHTQSMQTPLTIELSSVAHRITYLVVGISVLVFLLNLRSHVSVVESLLVSISLAVAAIPEGLPAIVTIVLSLGVKRLAQQKTIVKKLTAVETLGSIRVIATDKTGTLTQNTINVVSIAIPNGESFTVKGEGYLPDGVFFDTRHAMINPQKHEKLLSLLTAGILANNASYTPETSSILGDTTEGSLIVAAHRAKLRSHDIKRTHPRIFEVPFSSERKMMSVLVEADDTHNYSLYCKGAPEVILNHCDEITRQQARAILETTSEYAKNGLRSLAVAKRKVTKKEVEAALENNTLAEDHLTFLGLFGMQDPLRGEVASALDAARRAGVHTIMITGDHPDTAASLAREAGMLAENGRVFREEDIQRLSDTELGRELENGASVFARISPLGKLRLVTVLKKIPHMQVAVTGDGVNDAPALKAAHIGIAMGKSGTDIAREVADMVITDDNYATIVVAIREGRVIFSNLVKFIRYLISCNVSEVFVVTAAVFFGLPPPLLPIQILWINLVTDGFPALALGMDPPEIGIMSHPPRDPKRSILHKTRWWYMMIEGSIIGIAVFLLFFFSYSSYSYVTAQTLTFTTLGTAQLVHALNNRSTRLSLFRLGFFSNPHLIAALSLSFFLQFIAVQTSIGNDIFQTTALSPRLWGIVAGVSLIPFLVVEVKKQLRFRLLP